MGDVAGDAGPILGADGGRSSHEEAALDLLGVRAEIVPGAVAVSARLADPSAPAPRGYDAVSWTVSWRRRAGGRWFAQATRTSDGVRFTFDADTTAAADLPTSGTQPGAPVPGSVDPASGLVTIMVPRDALGSDANDVDLTELAAAAWATNASGAYTLVDTAPVVRPPVASSCGR